MARGKVPRTRRTVRRREERPASRGRGAAEGSHLAPGTARRPHPGGGGTGGRAGAREFSGERGATPETPTFNTTPGAGDNNGIPAIFKTGDPGGREGGKPLSNLISPLDPQAPHQGTTTTLDQHGDPWRTPRKGGSSSSVEDEVDMAATRAQEKGSRGGLDPATEGQSPRVEGVWPQQVIVDNGDLILDRDSDDSADRAFVRARVEQQEDARNRPCNKYNRPDITVSKVDGGGGVITANTHHPTNNTDNTDNHNHVISTTKYTCLDALINLVSIGSYLADVGTDIFLVYMYYTRGHWWWFGLTLTFILGPSVTMTCFSLRWYIHDHRVMKKEGRDVSTRRWVSRIVFLILQAAPVLRYIDTVVYGVRSQKEEKPDQRKHLYDQMLYEDTDSALLRLFECFMEAAPQLCLQLYVLTMFGPKGAVYLVLGQIAAAITSLISMSWALCSYHRSLRLSLKLKANMTYGGVALQFFWHFFTIGSRIIAIALFASYFKGWIFVLLGAHWCAMLVWILIQNTQFCKSKCEEFFFDVVAGLVYIFCYFNLTEGHTRLRYLFYYTVVYSENAAMILVWYLFTQTKDLWYHPYALVAVLGGFFIGIIFQVCYYLYFHPNNLSGDKKKRIPLCRPLDELVGEQDDKPEIEMSDITDYSDSSRRVHEGSPSSRISMGNSGYMEDSDSTDCIQPLMGDIC